VIERARQRPGLSNEPGPRYDGIVRRVFGGVCLAGVAACSWLTNLSDLSSAGDASDVATSEASDVVDAGAPFCDGGHYFCADFDEGDAAAGWTQLYLADGNAPPTQDVDCVSQPFSLACPMTASTITSDTYARFIRTLPPTTKSAHVELEVKIDDACTGTPAKSYFEILKLSTSNLYDGLAIKVDRTGWFLSVDVKTDAGTVPTNAYLSGSVSYGAWHHVVADVVYDVAGSISVDVEGSTASITAVDTISLQQNTGVMVGVYSKGTCPQTTIHFDNVAVDITQ
jgi:hypothetical protein